MADDLTQGLGLDPDEMQRRARLQGQLGMSDSAVGPPPTPRIPAPSANDKTPPVTLRGITPQLQQRTDTDETEAKRIQDTGSGISQIQHGSKEGGIGIAKPHPIMGGFLRGLDILGSAIAPNITANIPGTELHHERLGEQARGRIGSDIEEQGKEATSAETGARTAGIEATTAQTEKATELAGQPKPKEEKWSEFPGFTDSDGTPLLHEENSGQVLRANDRKPPIGFKATKPEAQFQTDKTVRIVNGVPHEILVDKQTGADVKDLGQTKVPGEAKEQGSYMPLYDEHGRVTGAWNPKSGHIAQPPQDMPGTTSAGAGIGSKANAATKKEAQPYQQMIDTAAEAHNLAEMAGKGNASADVDLVLSFFKTMKGSGGSGVRFTKQEQDLILGARNAGQGLEAIGQKVIGEGQPLTPEQRGHMVSVMDMHAKAAQQHLANMQGGQGTSAPAETPQPKSGVPTFAEWKAQQQHP